MNSQEKNILGTSPIGKLMLKFSIPCVISLLVNALYNIVDQIFIGRKVGYLGNSATNVIYPIVVISLAFSLLIGDGAASYLSIKLGEGDKEKASIGVGNAIITSIITGIIFLIVFLFALPYAINLFGCTDSIRDYALNYGYIIVLGLPFSIISVTLNSIIRADGSPKYSMASMLAGVFLNVILDPIFIFVFNMGVQGAAIATVIGEFVSFLISILYLKRFKSITLTKDCFKLRPQYIKNFASLGISSFINQMAITIVMTVSNNLLATYGASSNYGAEIPLAAMGIVMKVNQILISITVGIASGAQPIIGYNYGAGKYDRVKKALKYSVIAAGTVGGIAFAIFQLCPMVIVNIFGSESSLYNEFAIKCFKIYLMLTALNTFQTVSGIFFQAIGKPVKSAILTLSRQIVLLLPLSIIMAINFGIEGFLYAGPLSDAIAFTIALITIIIEMKHLGIKASKSTTISTRAKTKEVLKNPVVVTISREYGSGGRYVGQIVADTLGLKFYDKDFTKLLSEETGLSKEYIEENEQKKELIPSGNLSYNLDVDDNLFIEEAKLIKKIAKEQSCVIVGRCADEILKEEPNVINIFIYSPLEDKINRVTNLYHVPKIKASKEIKRINKLRANHYKHYTGKNWGDPANYDLCINSDLLGVEKTAAIICDMVKEKSLKK